MPHCGTILADQERQPIPWYFKFMLLATVVYLGWRIFQLISGPAITFDAVACPSWRSTQLTARPPHPPRGLRTPRCRRHRRRHHRRGVDGLARGRAAGGLRHHHRGRPQLCAGRDRDPCHRQVSTTVGDGCVIGHLAHLEGCVLEDDCLVGSGSVVLHRAVVGHGATVGANAVVTKRHDGARRRLGGRRPGGHQGGRSSLDFNQGAAALYVANGQRYKATLVRLDRS